MKRGSWVSSLTKSELALEILHTRSKIAQDSQKKSTKYLEKETIEVTFNSKSIQLKTKKNSSTGLTDVLSSVHPMFDRRFDALSAYLLWMQAGTKSKKPLSPVEPMVTRLAPVYLGCYVPESMFGGRQLVFCTGWTDASESTIDALDVLCSGELVWVDVRTSSAPVEPMPLRSMHRCNNTSLDTVSEPSTATIWTQRDQLNRRLEFLTRRFFRWSRFFCSGLPTAMWPSPLYIRATPGSFEFDTLNTWGHPWEVKRVLWAMR